MKFALWLWRLAYFASAGVCCFTIVHAVAVLGFHSWDRVLFGLPFGLITGWAELILFSFVGLASFYYFGLEYRKLLMGVAK